MLWTQVLFQDKSLELDRVMSSSEKPVYLEVASMENSITMIRKDAFSSLPNQIFLVASGDSLSRMTINAKDIKSSDKLKLKSPRFKDKILDYR
jgi:hypothetical protein